MAIRLVSTGRDTIRVVAGEADLEPTLAVLGPGEDYAQVPAEVWQEHYGEEVILADVVEHCRRAGRLVPIEPPRRRFRRPKHCGAQWLYFLAAIWGGMALLDQIDPWISRLTDWPVADAPPPLVISLILLLLAFACLVAVWRLENRQQNSSRRAV